MKRDCPPKSLRLVQLATIFGGSNRGVIRWDLYPFRGIKHRNSYKFLFFDMMTLGLGNVIWDYNHSYYQPK